MSSAPNLQRHLPRLETVVCPLGFVQGYRCTACCWAKLLPDAHVPWAVPFCYQVLAQKEFLAHSCQPAFEPPAGDGPNGFTKDEQARKAAPRSGADTAAEVSR